AREFGVEGDEVTEATFRFLRSLGPPADTFRPGDPPIGDARTACHDPEILEAGGLVAFVDARGDSRVGTLDPATGDFGSRPGHRVEGPVSRWSFYSNGPEWGLDAKGPARATATCSSTATTSREERVSGAERSCCKEVGYAERLPPRSEHL
ncbi:MAG: hypothetical protein MUE73_19540, partial [Planctomycetes bacterium]|nr:hypothetical protein [Planctomycetota bacterium]